MVVFKKKGYIGAKSLYSGISGDIREESLYSGKVVVFRQSGLGKVVVFGQHWLYSGKVVVFGKK